MHCYDSSTGLNSTSDQVSTGMGDHLWAAKPSQYVASHSAWRPLWVGIVSQCYCDRNHHHTMYNCGSV